MLGWMRWRKRRKEARRAAERAARQRAIEQEREQRLVYWRPVFDRAEAGDKAALDEIFAEWAHPGIIGLSKSMCKRYTRLYNERRYQDQRKNVVRLLAKLKGVELAAPRLERLKDLVARLDCYKQTGNVGRLERELGFTLDQLRAELNQTVKTLYENLEREVEDAETFERFWDLILRTRRASFTEINLRDLGVEPLPYPPNWNGMLAQYQAAPMLEHFRELPGRTDGEIRLLAAHAVDTDDLTEAQIALAYCNAHDEIREAVGDYLTALLARVVSRHQPVDVASTVEPSDWPSPDS